MLSVVGMWVGVACILRRVMGLWVSIGILRCSSWYVISTSSKKTRAMEMTWIRNKECWEESLSTVDFWWSSLPMIGSGISVYFHLLFFFLLLFLLFSSLPFHLGLIWPQVFLEGVTFPFHLNDLCMWWALKMQIFCCLFDNSKLRRRKTNGGEIDNQLVD